MSPSDPPAERADIELASAYVDGAVTADERAAVEASPSLLAQVAVLRSVRRALATAVPVDPVHRQSALDAALAAYDVELGRASGPAADAAVAAPPGAIRSIDAARRRRARRWTTLAAGVAAAAVVGVVGVGLLRSGGDVQNSSSLPAGGDQRVGDSATTAAAASGGAGAPATTVTAAATTIGEHANAPGPAAADAADLPELSSPADLLSLPVPVREAAVPTTVAPASGGAGAAATASKSGAPAAGVPLRCLGGNDVFLGEVRYLSRPAVVVRDPVARVRRALDVDTCAILAEVAETP